MKNRSKLNSIIFALVVVIVAAFSLVACGGRGDNSPLTEADYTVQSDAAIEAGEKFTPSIEAKNGAKIRHVELTNREGKIVALDDDMSFTATMLGVYTYKVTFEKGGVTKTVSFTVTARDSIAPVVTKKVSDKTGVEIGYYDGFATDASEIEVSDNSDDASHLTGGAITYYTIQQMNRYVAGNENGDVEFKVLIKSLATDGQQEEAGKTSFVIYGTATWSAVNELGVSVLEQYLNKWFTVKATAADKKVTVYNPDGTVAAEKVFEAYAANTISLAMHADIAVAAVNPAIPEICTVTYLDENGDEIHSEKVFKGGAASEYDYSKPDEDLGNGYTKNYKNIRWLDSSYNIADLNNVNADISVKLAYDVYVIKNSVVATSDKKLTEINKFVSVGKDGKITFSVRINETGWAGFNIVAAGGYLGISGGVSASSVWYVVSIDTATGEITVATEDGAIKGLDKGNYNPVATTVSDIYLKLTDGNLDLAALNPDIVNMEFYDTDKTTLLKTEWVIRGSVNYVHTFETDSEGYTRMVDTWAYVEGSENKVYAAKAVYVRNQTTTGSDVSLLATNKYARVDSEGKITFKIRIAQTGWTGLNIILGNGSYVGVSGGLSSNGTEWLTVTIDTSNGDVVILNASGNSLTLDTGTHKDEATTIDNIAVNVSGAAFDISVVA